MEPENRPNSSAQADQQAKLQAAFNFTEADLRENRQGRLSDSQVANLRARALNNFLIVAGVLAVLGVLVMFRVRMTSAESMAMLLGLGAPMYVAYRFTIRPMNLGIAQGVDKRAGQLYRSQQGDFHLFTPPYPADKPIPIIGGMVSSWLMRRYNRSFLLDTQQTSTGQTKQNVSYSMIVDDKHFYLTYAEHAAVTPDLYVVYFLPNNDKIVSLEAVAAPTRTESAAEAAPAPAEASSLPLANHEAGEQMRG
jgi:hypothetical protein